MVLLVVLTVRILFPYLIWHFCFTETCFLMHAQVANFDVLFIAIIIIDMGIFLQLSNSGAENIDWCFVGYALYVVECKDVLIICTIALTHDHEGIV